MIIICPYCGHHLPEGLKDGICFCPTCQNGVSSSPQDRFMSGAWMCYRQKCHEMSRIREAMSLTAGQAILIEALLIYNEYSMEDFRKEMMELGVINR